MLFLYDGKIVDAGSYANGVILTIEEYNAALSYYDSCKAQFDDAERECRNAQERCQAVSAHLAEQEETAKDLRRQIEEQEDKLSQTESLIEKHRRMNHALLSAQNGGTS